MKKSGRQAARVKRWLKCELLLYILLLPTTTVAVETAFVELVAPKNSAPWVGQRTVFAVEMAVEGRFSGSTLFDRQIEGCRRWGGRLRPLRSIWRIEAANAQHTSWAAC